MARSSNTVPYSCTSTFCCVRLKTLIQKALQRVTVSTAAHTSQGPNFCRHLDEYDKLKRNGFSIHGCIDGFSRKIIWLKVQRSKNPRIPKYVYFLHAVKIVNGCSVRVYTDMGAENGIVDAMQAYTYVQRQLMNMLVSNKKIECFWSLFRKQRSR